MSANSSSPTPTAMALFGRYWFLVGLLVVIPGGLLAGWQLETSLREWFVRITNPDVLTVAILFLMAFSLDSQKLRDSFRAPGPVIVGSVVNMGLLPLLTWPLLFLLTPRDFSWGLMIAAVVPCTLATASVSTRQAKGNDAISLLVTLVTSFGCVLVTPGWLWLTLGMNGTLDLGRIIAKLAWAVVLPTIVGQSLRWIPSAHQLATRQKVRLGIAAQSLVLVVVGRTAVVAGATLAAQANWPSPTELFLVTAASIGLHLLAMLLADRISKACRFTRDDRVATIFSGSQKTLPVGLLLASDPALLSGQLLPFITIPLLIFHAGQLLIDTTVAEHWGANHR